MTDQKNQDGRALVASVFLQRLDDAGMVRPKAMTVSKFDELRKRLCVHFAYLCEESLIALAEYAIDIGKGHFRHEWPPEATIRAFGHGLQKRPILAHPIVTSWLASVEGPHAVAGGFEVELYRLLQATPVPPNDFRMRQVREDAAASARRIELVRERIARETAAPADLAWLEAYMRDRQLVRAIVEGGVRKRAGGSPEGEAA